MKGFPTLCRLRLSFQKQVGGGLNEKEEKVEEVGNRFHFSRLIKSLKRSLQPGLTFFVSRNKSWTYVGRVPCGQS